MRIAAVTRLATIAIAGALTSASACSGAKECTTFSDCGSDETCSFPNDHACAATRGTCVAWSGACTDPPQPACACDGKTVFVACGFPGAPVALRASGSCPPRVGNACASPSDCDPAALCAYAIADGCSAKGTCVAPDHACVDTSQIACGCDGALVGLACIYGSGNAAAPVAALGACPHDAGARDGNALDAASDGD